MESFKFRVWFPRDRHMMSNDDLILSDMPIETILVDFGSESPKAVMQYVGMKDKNGKEIYGGDYVKVRSHSPPFCQLGLDKDCEGVVDFLECGFVVTDRKTFARPLFTEICDVEVIGNIYENPELLDDK